MKRNYTLFFKLFLTVVLFSLLSEVAQAQSGVYVGGHFRRERPSTVDILKKSGLTYVILFNVNVEANGDLTTDGELIVSNGTYVFANKQPYYQQDVASLKQGVTSINRVESCIGGWGNTSYDNIRNLINSQGTGTGSILYRNFAAFKAALPGMDAINNDDEHAYDATTAIKFHVMLKDLGMNTTVAPYTNWNYWNSLITSVNAQRPGAVDRIDLQCYDGGAGNNPCDWRIGGVKLHAGLLNFDSQQTINDKMTNWKNNCGVTGGFIWVYNDNGMHPGDYGSTINKVFGIPQKNMNAPVNIYKHCNSEGFANGIGIGDYPLSKLQSLGILDNDISGITAAAGLEVVLYDGDNFTGASVVVSGNNACLVNTTGNWNDRVTSLKVRNAGVPDGTGDGLTGNYFNGMNFETHKASRKDATINMDWGNGSPIAGVNVDQFSARWTGLVEPKYSGEYTFYVNSDNGRRLWVDGKLIIDKWIDDWNIDYSGKITLTAGQKYEIKLEYFENNGGAGCKMEWSSSAQAREVIPVKQLYANTLPVVSITSPSNNAVFTAPASITINATASDAGGSIAKVDFYNGESFLGSDNSSPYSYTLSANAAATYNLIAIATDNRGGVTNSSTIAATVNTGTGNIAPSVNITSPVSNASYNAPATITINANASDSDGSISKVEFFNGNTSLGSDNTSPYSFTWSNVAAGSYNITARATDNAGAVTTSAVVSVKVNNVVVNQPPAVSITSPANNASFNAPASFTINANASDSDGSISKVEFFNGGSSLGSDNSSPYSFTWNNVGAGTYSITAKATDNSGAVTTSSTVTIKVNTVVSNPCSGVAQYAEAGGYVDGSIVQNGGNRYKCKPYPFTGWCNGAAWAYAPGTGSYWGDAWTLVGSCTARIASNSSSDDFSISPNPATDAVSIQLTSAAMVSVFNTMGLEVIPSAEMNAQSTLDLSKLPSGMYLVKIDTGNEVITKTIIKK